MPSLPAFALAKIARAPMVVRAQLTAKRAIVAQMADDFRIIAAQAGCVVADDLTLLGWTPAQVETHGRAARERALALGVYAEPRFVGERSPRRCAKRG